MNDASPIHTKLERVVLASTNPGKIKDFQVLIGNHPIQLIPQTALNIPEIPETGHTFVENALLKARNAAALSGLPAIADDSGLVVDALAGAPGLHSARYAGPNASADENIQKLLNELAKIPNVNRKARFYAVLVFVRYPEDPTPLIAEGTWEGEILEEPTGENGFGYLPVFYSTQHHCSAALLSTEERTKINHRGQAFRKLIAQYLTLIENAC